MIRCFILGCSGQSLDLPAEVPKSAAVNHETSYSGHFCLASRCSSCTRRPKTSNILPKMGGSDERNNAPKPTDVLSGSSFLQALDVGAQPL